MLNKNANLTMKKKNGIRTLGDERQLGVSKSCFKV
jgi:hypothetical protein